MLERSGPLTVMVYCTVSPNSTSCLSTCARISSDWARRFGLAVRRRRIRARNPARGIRQPEESRAMGTGDGPVEHHRVGMVIRKRIMRGTGNLPVLLVGTTATVPGLRFTQKLLLTILKRTKETPGLLLGHGLTLGSLSACALRLLLIT